MLRQWDCPAFVCCGHAGVSTEHLDTASHSAFRAVMTRTGAADWQDWPSLPLLLHFAPRGLQKRRIVLQNRSMSEPHGPSGPGLFIRLMLALSAEQLEGIDASVTHEVGANWALTIHHIGFKRLLEGAPKWAKTWAQATSP
jgi:hypothetical protein